MVIIAKETKYTRIGIQNTTRGDNQHLHIGANLIMQLLICNKIEDFIQPCAEISKG